MRMPAQRRAGLSSEESALLQELPGLQAEGEPTA